jgi:hypothetical protein
VRTAAYLILTPILLLVGWLTLAGAAVQTTDPSEGTRGLVVAVTSFLMIPLGIAVGWRYRHRSLRLPAQLILTPVVLYFGWWLAWVLLLWSTGQESLVYGPVGIGIGLVSLLTVPLGIAMGWRRYQQR